MNKAILYGNAGKDAESRKVNDKTVTKFSLATNKTYTNGAGEKITETQWHNIVFWGKLAETAAKYVKKGTSLIIEGEINYRNYENKEGQIIYTTEILGRKFITQIHIKMNKEVEIVKFIKTTLQKVGSGKDENDPVRALWQYWDFNGNLIFEIDTFTKEVRYYE